MFLLLEEHNNTGPLLHEPVQYQQKVRINEFMLLVTRCCDDQTLGRGCEVADHSGQPDQVQFRWREERECTAQTAQTGLKRVK